MKKGFVLFLLAVMVMGLILAACAPATDVNGNYITNNGNSTPEPVGKDMVLVGQHNDVQVYKMVDNITGVTCYVTVNVRQYQPSGIYCVK